MLPACITYMPTMHVVQPAQTSMFVSVLNRPDAQGAHARSSIVLPGEVTNSPGWQSRCATHGVAGLRSSSH
jgi:hypothetical protein